MQQPVIDFARLPDPMFRFADLTPTEAVCGIDRVIDRYLSGGGREAYEAATLAVVSYMTLNNPGNAVDFLNGLEKLESFNYMSPNDQFLLSWNANWGATTGRYQWQKAQTDPEFISTVLARFVAEKDQTDPGMIDKLAEAGVDFAQFRR